MRRIAGVWLVHCVALALLLPLEPYMDEVYHIPQAQAYCQGDWGHWDDKITTFPGLYFASALPFRLIFPHSRCSALYLRIFNFLASILLYAVLCRVSDQLRRDKGDAADVALLLHAYPLSAFYYLVYYTDCLSLLGFCLCYCATLQGVHAFTLRWQLICLVLASFCILCRQTNAVWVMFLAGDAMWRLLRPKYSIASLHILSLIRFAYRLWTDRWELVQRTWPLLLPALLFALFVIFNGGVVVGDRSHHQLTLHPAMLAHLCFLYGVLRIPYHLLYLHRLYVHRRSGQPPISAAFGAIYDWLKENASLLSRTRRWLGYLALLSVGFASAACLVLGSQSHPFLLADNRHYTFYLWRRVLQHWYYRLAIAPLYSVCAVVMVTDLLKENGYVWLGIYFCAVALTLLPTPLLEPRYFTQALVVAWLHSPSCYGRQQQDTVASKWMIDSQLLAMLAMHLLVVYVYACRSFSGQDGSVARFMY